MSFVPTLRSLARPRSVRRLRLQFEGCERRALLAANARPLVMATLGDSLTDEYSFYGPAVPAEIAGLASLGSLPANILTVGRSSAQNWVQNLAATRSSQVTFGAYSTASRNETRNQGFAEDWARSGATATGANLEGTPTTFSEQLNGFPSQALPGLLTQTTADSGYSPQDVNVVTILIGSNDYFRAVTQYAGSLTQVNPFAAHRGQPNAVNAGIEASIRTAVAQVRHTIPKAKVVVVTPPDLTIAPVVQSALATSGSVFPGLGQTLTGSVTALNADLTRFAHQKGLGLVNTQSLYAKFRAKPTVAGVTVNLKATGQDLTDGFIGDGFHPGTIAQGVLAQAIVGQVDRLYGKQSITPLTNAEIVRHAQATQPAITLSATDNPFLNPSPLTLDIRATVTPGAGGTATPTGTVTFETITPATATTPAQPGTILGTVPVNSAGAASLTVPVTLPLADPIYAVYSGDQANDARLSVGVTPTLIPIP